MLRVNDPLAFLSVPSGTPRLASPAENIRDAVTTILGGAPSTIPGNMPPLVNMPQVILPRAIPPSTGGPVDTSGLKVNATTHEGQKRNDTMDLLGSIGNVAREFKQKHDQKVARDIEYDLNIIQAAASNPNDPHNQALLEELKNDKKRMGRLEKALGMNPFEGPQGVEQKTLQDYIAKSKQASTSVPSGGTGAAGSSQSKPQVSPAMQNPMEIPGSAGMPQPGMIPAGGAMSNLLGHMPNTTQINPQVALLGELVKAGLIPKADVSLAAYTKLTERMMTDDAALQRAKVTAEAANNRAAMRYLSTLEAIKERGQAAHEASQARVKSAQITANASRENTKDRTAAQILDTNTRTAAAKEIATQHDKTTLEKAKIQAGEKAKQDKINGLKKEGDAINQDMNSLNVQLAAALNSKDTKAAQKISQQLGKLLEKKAALEQQIDEVNSSTGDKEVDDMQKMIDDLLSERDDDGGPTD